MRRLRALTAAGVCLTALVVWALHPDPRAGALALAVGLAAVGAALLPRSDTPAFTLALLVIEAALAGDRASSALRAVLGLLLAVALWALHAAYALAAAADGAGPPPTADLARYAQHSARLLALAAPGVVVLALLGFLPRSTGIGSGTLRVAGLAVGAALSAIPVLLARHPASVPQTIVSRRT